MVLYVQDQSHLLSHHLECMHSSSLLYETHWQFLFENCPEIIGYFLSFESAKLVLIPYACHHKLLLNTNSACILALFLLYGTQWYFLIDIVKKLCVIFLFFEIPKLVLITVRVPSEVVLHYKLLLNNNSTKGQYVRKNTS